MRAAGVVEEHIYVGKRTGANMDREGLTALLGFARPGDRINVLTPDRLGRGMRETLNLVHDLNERGLFLRTLGDKLAVDTSGTSCTCTGWGSRSSWLPGGQSSGARSASSPLPQGKQGSPGFSRESTTSRHTRRGRPDRHLPGRKRGGALVGRPARLGGPSRAQAGGSPATSMRVPSPAGERRRTHPRRRAR
ncbi:recombinase family protein [Streptomyces avermitilis]|uniref:recombinase family protein n=1 Tax=Streptomyces avermitilis TaxID=33903 RepID=UPI0036D10E07